MIHVQSTRSCAVVIADIAPEVVPVDGLQEHDAFPPVHSPFVVEHVTVASGAGSTGGSLYAGVACGSGVVVVVGAAVAIGSGVVVVVGAAVEVIDDVVVTGAVRSVINHEASNPSNCP